MFWRFNTNLPDSAKAVGDRLAAALAPLGIVRGKDVAGGGTDVGPVLADRRAGGDACPVGPALFDWHHTPEDTLDKNRSRTASPECRRRGQTVLSIVANAPEEFGPVTPNASEVKFPHRRMRSSANHKTCDNLIVDRHIVAVIPPVSRTASRPGCETTVTFFGSTQMKKIAIVLGRPRAWCPWRPANRRPRPAANADAVADNLAAESRQFVGSGPATLTNNAASAAVSKRVRTN